MRKLNVSNILALFTVNFYILEGQALKSFYILEAQALKHWKNINGFGHVCLFERHLTLNYPYKLVESVPCFSLSFHFCWFTNLFINLWPFLWEKIKRKGLIGFFKILILFHCSTLIKWNLLLLKSMQTIFAKCWLIAEP